METRIKRYGEFTAEAISGTEIPVPSMGKGSYLGAGYGDTVSPNTIDKSDTKIVYSKLAGRPFAYDDFNDLYDEYLAKSKEKSIPKEFSEECIDAIIAEMG